MNQLPCGYQNVGENDIQAILEEVEDGIRGLVRDGRINEQVDSFVDILGELDDGERMVGRVDMMSILEENEPLFLRLIDDVDAWLATGALY